LDIAGKLAGGIYFVLCSLDVIQKSTGNDVMHDINPNSLPSQLSSIINPPPSGIHDKLKLMKYCLLAVVSAKFPRTPISSKGTGLS